MTYSELKPILQQPYSLDNFKRVLDDVFPQTDKYLAAPQQLFEEHEKVIEGFQFGNIQLSDGKSIALFDVKVADSVNISKNRKGLRDIAIKYIDNGIINGALVVFHSPNQADYRLSFIAKQSGFTQDGDFETTQTAPKRYTYILGKNESCTTAAKRLLELKEKNKSLDAIIDAFNVEKLNKDFFRGYKEHYERFWKYLNAQPEYRDLLIDKEQPTQDKAEKPIRDFAKKLLGRIVFLYFLQKKGWMGVPAAEKGWQNGDPNFVKNFFQGFANKAKFYADALVPLFFRTLNAKRTNDVFDLTNTKIPYLNGGLFDNDAPQTDHFNFPENYFAELFDFFDQYNFTIDENDPSEQEVGIDPEMLGHIFENLLEENKDKGTFYTPKVIVQFMCQEALIQYLKPHFADNAQIEKFIREKEISTELRKRENAQKIRDLLDKVRVCDPAIGSGAFPIGILQEIFEAKRYIFPYLSSNVFDAAEIKLRIIENSIYGVDMDKGAVDIARLRFWLALVVDEDAPRPLPNLDYKIMQGDSLFDTFEGIDISKIHQQSMKIYEPERDLFGNLTKPQMTIFQSQNTEDINRLLDEYFDIADTDRKKQIRKKVNEYVHEHIDFNIELREKQLDRQIAEAGSPANMTPKTKKAYEKLLNDKSKIEESRRRLHELQERVERPFFLWRLYFKEVFDRNPEGFDIILGNPPYFSVSKQPQLKPLADAYKTFESTGDIYALFYERGHQLLRTGGVLVYITGSSWLRSNYGTSLRKFFREQTDPLKLVDLSDCQIFESATVLTTIMAYRKAKNTHQLAALRLTRRSQYALQYLPNYFADKHIVLANQPDTAWVVLDRTRYDLKQHIEKQGKKLKEWDIHINRGVVTGFNEAFVLESTQEKEALIAKDEKSKELIKPFLRGRDIGKYNAKFNEQWLIGTFPVLNIDIENYPAIKEQLLSFGKERLEQNGLEGSRKKTGGMWFEIQDNIAYYQDFEKPKIIYPEITKFLFFTYDDKGYYTNNKCFILTGQPLKYLLGVFNSKLFRFAFEDNFPELQGNSRELRKVILEEIPIKYPTEAEEKNIAIVADYLLFLYDSTHERVNPYADNSQVAGFFEDIMNHLVCELYFAEQMQTQGVGMNAILEVKPIENLDVETQRLTIGEVFKQLQAPGSAVRKSIALVNIKLPDTVGQILSQTV